MRHSSTLIACLLLFATSSVAQILPPMRNNHSSKRHYMDVKIEAIDNANSDGVTRLSCTLKGIPHTSSRIDSVAALVNNRRLKATDIDGVDFARYFQWEESGAIEVEIDLPRFKNVSPRDTIIIYTVHGPFKVPLKKK